MRALPECPACQQYPTDCECEPRPMILPSFNYSINYCPPRKGEQGSMMIEARIGSRTVRHVVKCTAYSSMDEDRYLGSTVQYLLSKVRDSAEYKEAYALEGCGG